MCLHSVRIQYVCICICVCHIRFSDWADNAHSLTVRENVHYVPSHFEPLPGGGGGGDLGPSWTGCVNKVF